MEARSAKKMLSDNGGTRSGIERRHYTLYIHIPERRSGQDRRCGRDRRTASGPEAKYTRERRAAFTPSRGRPEWTDDPDSPQEN